MTEDGSQQIRLLRARSACDELACCTKSMTDPKITMGFLPSNISRFLPSTVSRSRCYIYVYKS